MNHMARQYFTIVTMWISCFFCWNIPRDGRDSGINANESSFDRDATNMRISSHMVGHQYCWLG